MSSTVAKTRPKHLNLMVIRLPVAGFVSIMHRVSGAVLRDTHSAARRAVAGRNQGECRRQRVPRQPPGCAPPPRLHHPPRRHHAPYSSSMSSDAWKNTGSHTPSVCRQQL